MAWIFLAESEESVLPWHHGLDHSPTVKTTHTHNRYFCPECVKENCRLHPFGMMCELSTWEYFLAASPSILFMAGFLARTLVLQEMEQAWKGSEAACSLKSSDSLASFDRNSFSWKMSQQSLFEDLNEFVWSSLRWGMIVDGLLYQPQSLVPHTSAIGGFSLPTPLASDCGTQNNQKASGPKDSLPQMARKNLFPTPRANDAEKRGDFDPANPRNGLPAAVKMFSTPQARDWKDGQTPKPHGRYSLNISVQVAQEGYKGFLNPAFVEAMQGYEIGHTDLDALGMQWFLHKQKKHLKD